MLMGNFTSGFVRGQAASLTLAFSFHRWKCVALMTDLSVGHSTTARRRGGAIGRALQVAHGSKICGFERGGIGNERSVHSKLRVYPGRSALKRLRSSPGQSPRCGASMLEAVDMVTSQDGSTTNHAPEGIGTGTFRVPAAHRLLATKTIFTIELCIKDQAKRLGTHTEPQHGADPVAQATLRWVRSTVVGLNLCPWAAGALAGDNMRVLVYPPAVGEDPLGFPTDTVDCDGSGKKGANEELPGWSLQELVATTAKEARALAALDEDDKKATGNRTAATTTATATTTTTLVVVRPPLATEFSGFLAVAEAVDEFIDDAGLRGTVQLATFHPRYRFEGSEDDDASNYTNRSPYPILHLLLEQQVTEAVSQVGNPARVWEKNVETTRRLGAKAMQRAVEACITSPDDSGSQEGRTR